MEEVMRKMITFAVTATAIVSAAALLSSSASAMTFGTPAGVLGAAQEITPIDNVAACWRYGWRGWGWYPCAGWRGAYGWHGGWRGYGWRGYGWRGGYGWRRW